MSLMNEGGGVPAVMNVEPAGSGCNNGSWGGDWGAWIILFLIFGMFGWGGMGGFGGFGGFAGMGGYPVEAILQRSLDTQTIIGKLDGINAGICDSTFALQNGLNTLGTTIMQGDNAINQGICNLGYNVQQGFNATQVAMMQGQNALQAQLADCCCKNQVGQMQIQNQMAADTCAVTNTIQNTTRDIIDNQNANSRAILDALNQNYVRTLENENQSLRLSASQQAQNAVLMAAMDANKADILRRTGAECPTPSYVVQPPTPVNFPTNCCGTVNFSGNSCGNCCA